MTEQKQGDARSLASPRGPILVPVDFSPYSAAALLFASELAEAFDLRLIVLHVVHDPAHLPGYYARLSRKKSLTRMEDIAGQMLDDFLADLKKKFPSRSALHKPELLLVKGIPVTRILQVAQKQKASLLVLGSKGVTGLRHLLLGSVAEQVVGLARIPVTVVKDPEKN